MAYKKSYQHYQLDQSDRKVLNITNFGGVDFSNQKFNVSSSRAIDLKNFVYRDGMVQKRFGYEQIYQVNNNTYYNELDIESGVKTNPNNFNGIWKFIAEDKQEHIVAHIGNVLYEVENINNDNIAFKMLYVKESVSSTKIHSTYELLNQKSFAFVSGNKLWVLGGIKYLCVRFDTGKPKISLVEEMDERFIPTTTYSITETYSQIDEKNGDRKSYQAVNMLTMWRKNALVTGQPKNKEKPEVSKYYEYVLDAPIVWEKESDMRNFSITIETLGGE